MNKVEIKKEVFEEQPNLRNDIIKNLRKYIKKNSEFRLLFNQRLKRLQDFMRIIRFSL
jgi:hypothetical protein